MTRKLDCHFIGKYGRVYTVDLLMKEANLSRQSAIARIIMAIKYPSKEYKLLRPNPRPALDYVQTAERLTPEQRETMRGFEAVASGELSIHKMLGER